jgi:hypothetical protein
LFCPSAQADFLKASNVPVSFINEGLHGGAPGGTIFPMPVRRLTVVVWRFILIMLRKSQWLFPIACVGHWQSAVDADIVRWWSLQSCTTVDVSLFCSLCFLPFVLVTVLIPLTPTLCLSTTGFHSHAIPVHRRCTRLRSAHSNSEPPARLFRSTLDTVAMLAVHSD